MMGLSYATGGSMAINGRKIVVIEKDDQGKPDLGKNLLAAAYGDDKVDLAVGPTASPKNELGAAMDPFPFPPTGYFLWCFGLCCR